MFVYGRIFMKHIRYKRICLVKHYLHNIFFKYVLSFFTPVIQV